MTVIAGLIYAGGESSRFGADKATALLQGRRLIDHVAERLEPQVTTFAVAGPVELTGAPCLDDGIHSNKGPLAGLLAGLNWAKDLADTTWLVTAPCDVPLLPTNLVALLTENLTDTPRILNIEERWQTGCALWPTSAAPLLENTLIENEDLSLHRALRSLNVEVIETSPETLDGSFLNINTQDDLIEFAKEVPGSRVS
ncbi:molybdenum cofactor guanylyltransferase [Parvibaculaceae bacterium PLY_AMNH_Bact1]|nr:molybdenum cofactor guanylyltransferase [Parvibaculaceae bacterium PLY_AMNH_Bact1]